MGDGVLDAAPLLVSKCVCDLGINMVFIGVDIVRRGDCSGRRLPHVGHDSSV